MPPEPQRPLFAQVGRNAGSASDPKSRGFMLLIAVGLLVGTGLLLGDLTERGRWVTVRVTLAGPSLDPEPARVAVPPDASTAPAAPATPAP
jgi:hypothetical protein